MFTGLIEAVGEVERLERAGGAARLTVTGRLSRPEELRLGDSVAVNGICLTVVAMGGDAYTFDVSPETLERSTIRSLQRGDRVNLEQALRLSDRLGGHLVSGHVDCIATLAERREQAGNIVFAFRIPPESARYLVAKGSVAVDGISLTVNDVSGDGFTVNVIPHTAARTTLGLRRPGDRVNIETDIIAKYVERLLGGHLPAGGPGLTMDTLARNGFL